MQKYFLTAFDRRGLRSPSYYLNMLTGNRKRSDWTKCLWPAGTERGSGFLELQATMVLVTSGDRKVWNKTSIDYLSAGLGENRQMLSQVSNPKTRIGRGLHWRSGEDGFDCSKEKGGWLSTWCPLIWRRFGLYWWRGEGKWVVVGNREASVYEDGIWE